MIFVLLSVAGFVLYLAVERLRIDRWRRAIPLTVIVTGTRGKSSVVRMLASVLRANGRSVLAKITGSSPRLLWPDGSETEIKRRGGASILEQKRLLQRAAASRVDCLVAEVMSIHSENHFVEAQRILRPDIVVVTNCWPDHIAAHGRSERDVAATLCLDIPTKATVIVPARTRSEEFLSRTRAVDGTFIVAKESASATIRQRLCESDRVQLPDNVDLVCGVADYLGIDDEMVVHGLAAASREIDRDFITSLSVGHPEKELYLVNAFSANDPTSTFHVYSKAEQLLPESSNVVGLMCLRSDRADRTAHWLEVLENCDSIPFRRVYVTGGHANVVSRRLASAERLRQGSPQDIIDAVAANVEDGTVVFGFGNVVGIGSELVEYWTEKGTAYGL